jgi:hypothetical protein
MTSSETRIDPARVLRCIEEARPLADGDVDPEAGAAFDTLAERHVPALLAEVERLRAAITEVLVMWDDCGLAARGEGPAIGVLRAALVADSP